MDNLQLSFAVYLHILTCITVMFYIWNKIIIDYKKVTIKKTTVHKKYNDTFKESDIKGKTISFEELINIMDRKIHEKSLKDVRK